MDAFRRTQAREVCALGPHSTCNRYHGGNRGMKGKRGLRKLSRARLKQEDQSSLAFY
jgi:hypothetical protein